MAKLENWNQNHLRAFCAAFQMDEVNVIKRDDGAPRVMCRRNKQAGFGVQVLVQTTSGQTDVTHEVARLLGLNMRRDGIHIDMGSDRIAHGFNPISQLLGWLTSNLKTPRLLWDGD